MSNINTLLIKIGVNLSKVAEIHKVLVLNRTVEKSTVKHGLRAETVKKSEAYTFRLSESGEVSPETPEQVWVWRYMSLMEELQKIEKKFGSMSFSCLPEKLRDIPENLLLPREEESK